MSNKLTPKSRITRSIVAAVLAMLFAGSAASVLASAMGLATSGAALYFAGLLAAVLGVLGAMSGGGAALAAGLFIGVSALFAATHAAGLGALKALFASWSGQEAEAARIVLGGRTLLSIGAFVLGAVFFAMLNRREFVAMAIMVLLAILVASHAMSADASLAAAVPGLIAAAGAFALTGGVQRDAAALRVLVPAALAVALALALSPTNRVTWPPLERAAERVRAVFEQYFNFTEERIAFSIGQEGYDHAGEVGDSVVSMLGGPAEPHTDPVMRVETDAQVLLRGAIRTAYTGYSWVDAAPKNRYLYYDLTHASIRDRVFNPGFPGDRRSLLTADVSVEMLDEGTSTLFVPGRLEKFEMDLSTAVYYNTAGEMFLTREVRPGDRYRLRALQVLPGNALREAVVKGEGQNDDRWQEILSHHTQLPEGIEGGVYALTMQLTGDLDNPYDRAMAIMDYLRRETRYTLDTEYPPQGRDFVSYFLLDSKAGYCSYYATAMAVMGRIAGLPTRYVEGYLARPGEAVLTGENAHAWAEIYFRGVGWVPFDATGGATGRAGMPDDGGEQVTGDDGQDGEAPSTPAEGDYDGGEPTPTPSPEPEDGGGQDDEPTPSPEPEDGGGQSDEPTPSPEPEDADLPDPADAPEAPPEKDRSGWQGWLLAILLLLALIALAARWVRSRLDRANPARLAGEARTARQAGMIVYRANLTLLSHMGQTPVNGETPEAFAARAAEQFKNPEYADFVRAVAESSYGRKPLTRADIENGLRAYAGFQSAMGRRERLRFTLTRVFRGLGNFEQIP